MNGWQSVAVMLVLQLTVITALAALAITAVGPRPALRHAIGALALCLLLLSPVLTLCLPAPTWLATAARGEDRASQNVAARAPQPNRAGSSELAASRSEARTTPYGDPSPGAGAPLAESASPQESEIAAVAPFNTGPSQDSAIEPNVAQTRSIPARPQLMWLGNIITWLACVWAAVVAILLARFLRAQRRLHSLAKSVVPATIEPATAAAALRALGTPALPRIGVSRLAPMPLVLGCRRPLVVLPASLLETASADRLRDVLIHESAHVARRDPVVHLAQHAARIAFWPHLGVHWLNQQIARSREEVCDNFVLNNSSSADYAQTLFELAQTCGPARFGVALLGMFSLRWRLEHRIAGILNPTRSRATQANRRPLAIALLLLLAGSLLVGGAGANFQRAQEPAATDKAQPDDGDEKTPLATQRINVQGACHDQDGKPVANLWVRVFRWGKSGDHAELLGEARTEAGGAFAIPNVNVRAAGGPDDSTDWLHIVATSPGHVSVEKTLSAEKAAEEIALVMADKTAAISGTVSDAAGKPLAGVEVFVPCRGNECIPQFRSAISDERGCYVISDLAPWKPVEKQVVGADGAPGFAIVTAMYFRAKHPDYALTTARYGTVPQEVNITLQRPAILEGTVVDEVTGKPLAGAVVTAQGVGRSESLKETTDRSGAFRIKAIADYYNIWAEADDRIAIAAHNVVATAGQTVRDISVRMVRGGFVVGTVTDETTDKPVVSPAENPVRVAHYGPARPRSTGAVLSTRVDADGAYRLRVAPGKSYVYLMGGGNSGYVDVADDAEVKLDLRTGKQQQRDPQAARDPDLRLREKLMRAARAEEQGAQRQVAGGAAAAKPEKYKRADTKVGRLLEELEDLNAGSARFTDSWLSVLKAIVDVGPDAVPEVIAELDATENDMMLRCCGFMLRAIGDKRAVPALIRALPKTLLKPGSDMGLRAEDKDLGAWAQKHDVGRDRDGPNYDFGRPVREIADALETLTGQKFGEEELFHVFLTGLEHQRQMKRGLFWAVAQQWANWWKAHAAEFTKDPAYQEVNLGPSPKSADKPPAGAHFKTGSINSNWLLESVLNPKSSIVFFDFDTERTARLPPMLEEKDLERKLAEIVVWATAVGYDMMGAEYVTDDGTRVFALRALDMQAWELDVKNWKREIGDTTLEELKTAGVATDGWLLHYDAEKKAIDPKATGTFFYITREGTPGLVYVGIEVQDDSLKPGGIQKGDNELDPVAFRKGRRFGYRPFEEVK